MLRLLGGLVVCIATLYCPPRRRTGNGRGKKGTGLYPELAALRMFDGLSPNLQSEVARLVATMPIERARVELARRGIDLDEKTVHRIALNVGLQMLAVRTEQLWRFRSGQMPAGTMFAGKRIAVAIDGGRVRIRKVNKKSRVGKKRKRRSFCTDWREPKVLTIYELDEKGRKVRGSKCIIDGTLKNADAAAELVAMHLHRLGAAAATEVVFLADGAPWIWDRLPWIRRRVGIAVWQTTEVLDWSHAVHHISLALEALGIESSERRKLYREFRGLLKRGREWELIDRLNELAIGQSVDSDVWVEICYFEKHANAGRLRYAHFRRNGVPQGSGAIESTIRRVINLRLKGNGIFWKEENAEAIFQLRAALLSDRWDEQLAEVHEKVACDRRSDWEWQPIDIMADLKVNTVAPTTSPQLQAEASNMACAA
jgi:hypothetical protein